MRTLNSLEISQKSLQDSVGKPQPISQLYFYHFYFVAYNGGALLIVEVSLPVFSPNMWQQFQILYVANI